MVSAESGLEEECQSMGASYLLGVLLVERNYKVPKPYYIRVWQVPYLAKYLSTLFKSFE